MSYYVVAWSENCGEQFIGPYTTEIEAEAIARSVTNVTGHKAGVVQPLPYAHWLEQLTKGKRAEQ